MLPGWNTIQQASYHLLAFVLAGRALLFFLSKKVSKKDKKKQSFHAQPHLLPAVFSGLRSWYQPNG